MKNWKILNLSQGWTKENQMQQEGRNPKGKKPNKKMKKSSREMNGKE